VNEGTRPNSTRAAVLVPFAVVTLVWGSTWLVIRGQLGVVPPSWSVAYRFAVAGVALLGWAAWQRERPVFDRGFWTLVALLAVAQFCLNFNFVYRSEAYITSGLVAVCFALLLVPNAILARLFLGQRMGGQLVVGSGVAISGIALLFLHEAHVDRGPAGSMMAGLGFVGAAVLSASTANVLQATSLARRYPMIPTLGVSMLLGAAIDAAVAWVMTGPPVVDPSPAYLFGVLYLGLAASALAFPLYFGLIRVIGPAKAAYSGVVVPVIAMLLSTVFEGYRWSVLAACGAALAMAGLIVALTARRPNR
jgi:drug/metabolite transporter (DMT)-like permease